VYTKGKDASVLVTKRKTAAYAASAVPSEEEDCCGRPMSKGVRGWIGDGRGKGKEIGATQSGKGGLPARRDRMPSRKKEKHGADLCGKGRGLERRNPSDSLWESGMAVKGKMVRGGKSPYRGARGDSRRSSLREGALGPGQLSGRENPIHRRALVVIGRRRGHREEKKVKHSDNRNPLSRRNITAEKGASRQKKRNLKGSALCTKCITKDYRESGKKKTAGPGGTCDPTRESAKKKRKGTRQSLGLGGGTGDQCTIISSRYRKSAPGALDSLMEGERRYHIKEEKKNGLNGRRQELICGKETPPEKVSSSDKDGARNPEKVRQSGERKGPMPAWSREG